MSAARVLIVEDNVDSAESMAAMLGLLSYDVQAVHDGFQALGRARTFKPSIVLCDIGLPGMSGYEVAKHLRAAPETKGSLLVAITGYGEEGDKAEALRSGFDRHLVLRPVSFFIVQLLCERSTRPSGRATKR